MTHRIDEVARFTRQPRAVAEFYATVLDRPAPDSGRDTFNFDVNGVNLFIHPAGDGPPEPGWPENVDHIAVAVADLDAECARLARAGIRVMGPSEFPWGRSAYMYDPDGRMVELHAEQPRATTP